MAPSLSEMLLCAMVERCSVFTFSSTETKGISLSDRPSQFSQLTLNPYSSTTQTRFRLEAHSSN